MDPAAEEPAEDPAQEMQPGEESAEGGMEDASPEEQKQFDSLLQPIYDAIHGEGAESVMQQIKAGAENIGETIGEIAAQMLISIEQIVSKSSGKILPAVKLQVILELVEELVSIANAAGIIPDDEATMDKVMKQAATNAIGMYGAHVGSSGGIDKNQIAGTLQKMSGMGGVGGEVASATMKMIQSGGGAPQ